MLAICERWCAKRGVCVIVWFGSHIGVTLKSIDAKISAHDQVPPDPPHGGPVTPTLVQQAVGQRSKTSLTLPCTGDERLTDLVQHRSPTDQAVERGSRSSNLELHYGQATSSAIGGATISQRFE